jgi:chromosome segregation ATPase
VNDLKDLIFEQAKSYADVARAAHDSRNREVELLRHEILLLEEKLRRARAEILDLKARIREPVKPIEGFDGD